MAANHNSADTCAESLKWESISGANFSITKPLNPNFFLTHRCVVAVVAYTASPGCAPDPCFDQSALISTRTYLQQFHCRINMGTRDTEVDPTKVLRGANPEYSFGATVANDKVRHCIAQAQAASPVAPASPPLLQQATCLHASAQASVSSRAHPFPEHPSAGQTLSNTPHASKAVQKPRLYPAVDRLLVQAPSFLSQCCNGNATASHMQEWHRCARIAEMPWFRRHCSGATDCTVASTAFHHSTRVTPTDVCRKLNGQDPDIKPSRHASTSNLRHRVSMLRPRFSDTSHSLRCTA